MRSCCYLLLLMDLDLLNFFSNSLINVDVINYPCIFWYKWDICFTQLKTERMAVLVQTIFSGSMDSVIPRLYDVVSNHVTSPHSCLC